MIPEAFNQVCRDQGWAFADAIIDISLDGGRAQRVQVELFEAENTQLIRITTAVGDADALTEIQLRSALGVNHGLPHGALAIRNNTLVLTDTFPAGDTQPERVLNSLRFLAETADRYEKILFGTDVN